MATTLKAANARIREFLQASRGLASGPGIPTAPFTPSKWGSAISARVRKRYPECAGVCDTLDRLRAEHLKLNAEALELRDFRRELRRLAKL